MSYTTPVPFLARAWKFVITVLGIHPDSLPRYWWFFPRAKMVKRKVVQALPHFTKV
jgi:hypothetical protein